MTTNQLTKKIERVIRKATEARKEAAELFLQVRNSDLAYVQELAELLKSVAYSSMGLVGEPITKNADKSIERAYNIAAMKHTWTAIRKMAKEDSELEQRIEDARWSSEEQRKLCLSLGYAYLETESIPETI
jgi:ribosome biogenesis protein Nip4